MWRNMGKKYMNMNLLSSTNKHVNIRTGTVSAQEIFIVHHLVPLVPVRAFSAVLHGCQTKTN